MPQPHYSLHHANVILKPNKKFRHMLRYLSSKWLIAWHFLYSSVLPHEEAAQNQKIENQKKKHLTCFLYSIWKHKYPFAQEVRFLHKTSCWQITHSCGVRCFSIYIPRYLQSWTALLLISPCSSHSQTVSHWKLRKTLQSKTVPKDKQIWTTKGLNFGGIFLFEVVKEWRLTLASEQNPPHPPSRSTPNKPTCYQNMHSSSGHPVTASSLVLRANTLLWPE